MKRWLVRLAFASGVWARTSDLRRLFRCLTLGAAVLARRCHARTERVCTLLCFLGSHFLSLHFGSRADDPSPNANLQERVFLYKKEHVANRGSHSRSHLSRSKLMTLWSLTRLKPGTRIPNSAIRGKTGHPEISRARSRLGGSAVPANADPAESSAKPVSGQFPYCRQSESYRLVARIEISCAVVSTICGLRFRFRGPLIITKSLLSIFRREPLREQLQYRLRDQPRRSAWKFQDACG
jgi:hypothetical protein